MEIIGTIKNITDEQQISDKFRKRELIIEEIGEHAQTFCIEFANDKIDLIDPYGIGEEVKVSVNVRSKEWVNKDGKSVFFVTFSGWKIERA